MYDAHNHLQDSRFDSTRASIIRTSQQLGIKRCVVNGTSPEDWDNVRTLAELHPDFIIPSYGLHPWKQPSLGWQKKLITYLDDTPNACVGECGLDRWIKNHDTSLQSQIFHAQLDIAAERNLPLTIHCLRAWGQLIDILESNPLPARGFLLHSYSGSAELIPRLVKLGAYFSFSGYFLHPRKHKIRSVFKAIPSNRILIETDAPDMSPPEQAMPYKIENGFNHPGNLKRIYEDSANLFDTSMVNTNFEHFFLNPW